MWIELLIGAALVVIVISSYREGADSTLAPTPTCPTGAKSEGNGMCIQLTGVSPDSNNSCPRGFEGKYRLDGPYTFEGEFQEFDGKCIKYIQATCPSGYLVDASAGLKCIPAPPRRNPGGAPPEVNLEATSPDPTSAGNMSDLEAEYQRRKTIYDNLVASALATNDASKVDAIAAAKQAMNETLSKMLALSAGSGTPAQQEELIRRVMEIQRDYNGLLVSTDKLETLRKIHQFQDSRTGTDLKIYGLGFLIAGLALIVLVTRTRE